MLREHLFVFAIGVRREAQPLGGQVFLVLSENEATSENLARHIFHHLRRNEHYPEISEIEVVFVNVADDDEALRIARKLRDEIGAGARTALRTAVSVSGVWGQRRSGESKTDWVERLRQLLRIAMDGGYDTLLST